MTFVTACPFSRTDRICLTKWDKTAFVYRLDNLVKRALKQIWSDNSLHLREGTEIRGGKYMEQGDRRLPSGKVKMVTRGQPQALA